MIDQELILQETFKIQQSIKTRKTTHIPGLFVCQDLLNQLALEKLQHYITNSDPKAWATVDRQENLNRRKIAWQADTIIEELHTAFDANTDILNLLFPETKKRFLGLQIWKDWSGYSLDWHADNDLIDMSLQIYLYHNDDSLGTTFSCDNQVVVVPYQHNTGYLAKNTKKLLHKTTRSTPNHVTRYSLYAVWTQA